MRTGLDHLPDGKRRELARIVEILFAEFEDALKGRNAPHRKAGRILKIILFGSYARGDWVDDPKGGYKSDYDLLVVVNHQELADLSDYWGKADDHLLRAYQIAHELTAPANFIVHSLTDVNKQLKKGRPFFVDIVRDGIALYEAPDHPFEQPQPLSAEEARKEALGYFDEWIPSAEAFLQKRAIASNVIAPDREAAFLMHQAAERLYHGLLLVLTLYSPKSHKLNFLRSQALSDCRLITARPRESRGFEQRSTGPATARLRRCAILAALPGRGEELAVGSGNALRFLGVRLRRGAPQPSRGLTVDHKQPANRADPAVGHHAGWTGCRLSADL